MTDQEILQKLELETMPKEVQDQTLSQVNQVVELRVAGVLGELLDESQMKTFEELSSQGPEKVWNWLTKEGADVAQIYEAALTDYLDEVVAKN